MTKQQMHFGTRIIKVVPRIKAAFWLLACLLISSVGFMGCKESASRTVIIYTSQDEEYAEPIFKEFEKQTGITVKPGIRFTRSVQRRMAG